MMPFGQTLTLKIGSKECETAYGGWRQLWNYGGGRRDANVDMHADLIDMQFVHSFQQASYNANLSEVVGHLCEEILVLMEPSMSLWRGHDNFSDEHLTSGHDYWVKHIDFDVCLRWRASQYSNFCWMA